MIIFLLFVGNVVLTRMPPKPVCKYYSKIYTKTGDQGTSALFTGVRKPKDDVIFRALGTTDELSCHIGAAAEHCRDADINLEEQLNQIQCILQDVGSNVATPQSSAKERLLKKVEFSHAHVELLESWIDEMTAQLPPLRNFVLPSGGKSATCLHVARAVCRRAEREITPLIREGEIDSATFMFMNRLSDYLFTAARFAAMKEGREEKIYRRITPPRKEQ
ncbi:corrinoid adenosyltransferase MMAB-like isoform X2 [Babylonia areolata]|uniref:corrinoid adenosyltransferase MMAB-like isoform X2 n=1 Tax=Babylonia areolata TaxID=304850 RepID=UPI003FD06AC7